LSHEYIITLPVVSVCVMGGTVSGPNSLGIWTTGRRTGGSWRRKHLNSVRQVRAAPCWFIQLSLFVIEKCKQKCLLF